MFVLEYVTFARQLHVAAAYVELAGQARQAALDWRTKFVPHVQELLVFE